MEEYRDELQIGKFFLVNIEDIALQESSLSTKNTKFEKYVGTVYVYGGEGKNVPHFHILQKNQPDCCIGVYEAKYFSHGTHTGKLNSKQCKLLNEWMSSQSTIQPQLTNWEAVEFAWRIANDINSTRTNLNTKQPDYSNIK